MPPIGQSAGFPCNTGVFQWLLELLELDCHRLDPQLALSATEESLTLSSSYKRYMNAKHEVITLDEEIQQKEGQLKQMEQ